MRGEKHFFNISERDIGWVDFGIVTLSILSEPKTGGGYDLQVGHEDAELFI